MIVGRSGQGMGVASGDDGMSDMGFTLNRGDCTL